MKVLITNRIPNEIIKKYKENFKVDYNDSLKFLSKEELKTRVRDAEALVCSLSEKIDSEIIDAVNNLKIIVSYGAGFDGVDTNYAKEEGTIIINAPASASTKSTAELTFGLIIDLLRSIMKMNSDRHDDSFERWKFVYGSGETLEGKTLGIIKLGRTGTEVTRKAKASDMDVISYNCSKKEVEGAKRVDLDFPLENSDVMTLHVAYSDELHHLTDAKALLKMKKTALLINSSHDKVINEKDSIDALNDGEISGCALDVYEFEPKVSEELRNAKNVLLASHLGNATKLARVQMGEFTSDNIMRFKNGEIPKNKVN